jgi:hypothetical protein
MMIMTRQSAAAKLSSTQIRSGCFAEEVFIKGCGHNAGSPLVILGIMFSFRGGLLRQGLDFLYCKCLVENSYIINLAGEKTGRIIL